MKNKIYIFDTTLRDGEQAPGIHLNVREKLEIAEQLSRLNVDIIEAGFPISSESDFEAVREVSKIVRGRAVAALARANDRDIDSAGLALKDAEQPIIHTFRVSMIIAISSRDAFPARSPIPFTAHSICLAPCWTAIRLFATARPRSLWQCTLNTIFSIPSTLAYK